VTAAIDAQRIEYAAIMIYLVGNALIYNHLVKADPSKALDTWTMLENLASACVWPIYWLLRLI
jgi:uncharacterized membrane protein